MITERIDRMMHSCRSRGFRPTSILLGRRECRLLVDWLDDLLGPPVSAEQLTMTPEQRLQGSRYRDTPIDVCALESFLRVEAIWVDAICEAEDLIEPAQTLEQEIAMTTRHPPAEAKRLANALAGAPTIVLSGFRAMTSVGCYSVDEMLERIAALRQMAR